MYSCWHIFNILPSSGNSIKPMFMKIITKTKTILLNLQINNSSDYKPIVTTDKCDWFYVDRLNLSADVLWFIRQTSDTIMHDRKANASLSPLVKFWNWTTPNIRQSCLIPGFQNYSVKAFQNTRHEISWRLLFFSIKCEIHILLF